MRVVMVDPGAFTPFYDDALCRALADEGCEVELVTAPFAYHPWPEARGYLRRELFAPGAGTGGFLHRSLRRLQRAVAYPRAWRRLVGELAARPPAIVHLQWSLAPAVERPALRRLRAAGVAVVQTVHNACPHGGERAFAPAAARLDWRAGRPGAAGDTMTLVALSEATAQALVAGQPALAGTIRIIPPGIDAPGATGARERLAARLRLGLEAEAPLALFLGLIRPYKGLDLLLEAFAEVLREVPAAGLVVAGLPRPSFRPYARQIDRLGLGERVRTDLRYLPQTVMDDYLAAADLVVLPYRGASQSAVLGAALAADRPVVASATGGLPEMLGELAAEMLVPVGDAAALARAMSRRLGDRAAAAELGRRAGSAARQRFSWRQSGAATAALYRELIGAAGSGAKTS